ncbi:uncharacterized protein LOC6618824 [Drosophila sechellia]|uniref:uncharacterized protein LOC6618824 n=1 Tax=Drosophila sechellia TaxID=7238 RepID=UPI0013DE3C03|nr:uncharacterized protein LOC6618824 [Drosophila sechellia]
MRFHLIILTVVCLGHTCAQPEVLNLNSILVSLRLELSFETLLILRGSGGNDFCWEHFDLDRYPHLNFNANQSIYLKGGVSRKILALVCLDSAEETEVVMKALGENLMDMRGTPILLLVGLEANISSLFEGCFSHQMLNVLALSTLNPKFVYSYRAFPFFKVVRRRISQVDRFFGAQVKDLQGYPIATVPYNLLPRSVIYKDGEGRRQMTGYLTHFYRNFARSLNASLLVRWDLVPEDETPSIEATAALLRDGLVDFPLVLTTLAPEPFYPSHVGEITSWFLMLPVEPDVSPSSLYFNLKGWQYFLGLMIILALLLVNAHRLQSGQGLLTLRCGNILGDHVLRAILAQSFVMPSRLSFSRTLLYSLLMMAGLIVSTFYSANLATLLVHPPAAFRILSYDDLRRARGKILISQQELPTLNDSVGREVLERNLDTFEVTPSVVDFLAHRNELNTSFAYPVTNTLWPFLQLKQIRMHRPLFRRSNEITFTRFMPVTMPMARNSIYRDVFNTYLSRTLASGLYDLWFRRSYQEAVAVGKLNYTVDPAPSLYHDLVWEDLYYVWIAYLGGTMVGIGMLAAEIACSKWGPLRRAPIEMH